MEPIAIRLMGYPQLLVGTQDVSDQLSTKALALLIYLSLQKGAHTRLELAGLLWGDMNEARARANLRSALHNIRQVLPEVLEVSRSIVAISPTAALEIDVRLIQNTVRRPAQIAGRLDAVQFCASHRAEFLEGFYIDSAPEFDAWVLQEREHLRLIYLQCLEKLADAAARQGDWSQAIEVTRQMLALEPWLESAQRRMMLLLARSGHCNQALAQFETCRQVLDEELSISPEPETWKLYEMIKHASLCPRHNLPAFPTPFIGRQEELATLQRWLRDPDCRMITLAGLGGLGKTRLAVEAARSTVNGSQRLFLHGAFYTPLPERSSTDQFIPTIAQSIGMPLSDYAPFEEQLRNYLREKELLLLIDAPRAELIDAHLLARLLREAPGIKLIVISPARLNLHWEWFFPLQGLAFPRLEHLPCRLSDLEDYEAGQLFLENARRVPHRLCDSESIQAVGEICAVVEGLPLAIELAAARLRSLSAVQIIDHLRYSLEILQAEFVDLPDRHRNLAHLLAWSWGQLPPTIQSALGRLAAYHQVEFTSGMAQVLSGLDANDLGMLVDCAFLRRTQADKYEIPKLLRRFASQQVCAQVTVVPPAELVAVC